MYDWLRNTFEEPTTVVTANRRLARLLRDEYGQQQLAAGVAAWRSPEIVAWPDWVARLVANDGGKTRLNSHQSQVLWERCLRREFGDVGAGLTAAVRLARETWQRLADAQVGIREVAASIQNEDHRMFASAAGTYLAILDGKGWIDDAQAASAALELIRSGTPPLGGRIVLAGFDRETQSQRAICNALQSAGTPVHRQVGSPTPAHAVEMCFESGDAEMRAAGAWARDQLEANPGARLAIVKQGLEQSATRDARLLREGFVPGWQYGPRSLAESVNVSYGRRLPEYPAISIALLALRWLRRDLPSRDVAALLMSPFVGNGGATERSRLELRLRDLPDRAWSPAMITSALRHQDVEPDWLKRIAALGRQRRELPKRDAPHAWAERVTGVLETLGWPGPDKLNSDDYQLVNRWRELLNSFARLSLVDGAMSAAQATARLESMAADTVFQTESTNAAIQLLGPLEAAGLEFDAIWVAGLSASNWPAAGRPSPLVSRKLQIEHNMPDATPADTLAYADTLLTRLLTSAGMAVCSWSRIADDTEQTVSELLRARRLETAKPVPDPGWHAAALTGTAMLRRAEDPVPALNDEKVFGGAGTIEAQLREPFTAFVQGRLGANRLYRQAVGIPASLRGNVIHDALYRLYQALPDSRELRRLDDAEIDTRVATAVSDAFVAHERNTDAVLLRLLQMERVRIMRLVGAFVRLDRERDGFRVAGVEGRLEFHHDNLRLSLRYDRVDAFDDGKIAILDYKTGRARELLTKKGDVREPQLFVYAMASEVPVAALALVNIDSREITLSGGGRGFTDEDFWPGLLESIGEQIRLACDEFNRGDVRIAATQYVSAARAFNVLSRFTELRHDD